MSSPPFAVTSLSLLTTEEQKNDAYGVTTFALLYLASSDGQLILFIKPQLVVRIP